MAGECFACPLGEEPNDAQRDCNQCDDIHVSEDGRQCMLCGNFSQPNPRRDTCTPCNPVQESFDAAERRCVCAPGQTRVGGHCQSCPPQQFKPHSGDGSCSACGTSTQSNRDHTACVCPVNTYNITYGMIKCFGKAEQITAEILEVEVNTAGMAPCQTCDDLLCVNCGMIPGSNDVASHVTVREGYGLPLSLLDSGSHSRCPGFGLPLSLLENGYTGLQSGTIWAKNIFGCPKSAESCSGEPRESNVVAANRTAHNSCMPGYCGVLCNQCMADRSTPANDCALCSQRSTTTSLAVAAALLVLIVVIRQLKKQRKETADTGLLEALSPNSFSDSAHIQTPVQTVHGADWMPERRWAVPPGGFVLEDQGRHQKQDQSVWVYVRYCLFPVRIMVAFAQVYAHLPSVVSVTHPQNLIVVTELKTKSDAEMTLFRFRAFVLKLWVFSAGDRASADHHAACALVAAAEQSDGQHFQNTWP